jgi:hypothetical protein
MADEENSYDGYDDPCEGSGRGWVYFIQAEGNGLIKIGWTDQHPETRLTGLRTMSPVRLMPLGVLRRRDRVGERNTHLRFVHLRQHGEWFEPGRDLLDFIRDRAKPWPKIGDLPLSVPTPDRMRIAHQKEYIELLNCAMALERMRSVNTRIEYYI